MSDAEHGAPPATPGVETPASVITEAARDAGFETFEPEHDAIKIKFSVGTALAYVNDGALQQVTYISDPTPGWRSPRETTPTRLRSRVEATPTERLGLVDRRAFDWLSMHAGDRDRVHDGLLWGIARKFGVQFRAGSIPSVGSFASVTGISAERASSIHAGLPDEVPARVRGRRDE